jgi:hypothetical protein
MTGNGRPSDQADRVARDGGTMDWLDDPDLLWHRTRPGREEYVQRLLATLILGEEARGWNVRRSPSERGASFLRELHGANHAGTPAEPPIFVDEFELPARHDTEKAGWPDHAVEWPDRLFLIELKTERRSHRPGQLAHYLELAAHHHPDRGVDLLYLTPTMDAVAPEPLPPSATYAHAEWPAVGELIATTWAGSDVTWERTVAGRLAWWIEQLELGAALPVRDTQPSLPSEPARESAAEVPIEPPGAASDLDAALHLAALVQRDGEQRAVEADVEDPEDLDELRLEVRDHLASGLRVDGEQLTHVRPWIWSAATTDGQPLTRAGERTGYELRLSRYRKAQYG